MGTSSRCRDAGRSRCAASRPNPDPNPNLTLALTLAPTPTPNLTLTLTRCRVQNPAHPECTAAARQWPQDFEVFGTYL